MIYNDCSSHNKKYKTITTNTISTKTTPEPTNQLTVLAQCKVR